MHPSHVYHGVATSKSQSALPKTVPHEASAWHLSVSDDLHLVISMKIASALEQCCLLVCIRL